MKIDTAAAAAQIAGVADGEVDTDKSLAPYTSYNIGGPTAIWVAPKTEHAVGRVLKIIHDNQWPFFILGRGSNLLVSDSGWHGATLYLGENFSGIEFDQHQATAMAGTLLMDLIHAATHKGLSGVELLAGIPGGIGGALRMNAGAFGQEIGGRPNRFRDFAMTEPDLKRLEIKLILITARFPNWIGWLSRPRASNSKLRRLRSWRHGWMTFWPCAPKSSPCSIHPAAVSSNDRRVIMRAPSSRKPG